MTENLFTEYQPYLFIAIGLGALLYAVLWTSSKSKLKEAGRLAEGIVFDQDNNDSPGNVFRDSPSFAKDKITIRFVTQTGEWITGALEQDFQLFFTGQYKNGDTVKVYYNENRPSEFYVDTKQSEFAGRLIFVAVGFGFLLVGLYQYLA